MDIYAESYLQNDQTLGSQLKSNGEHKILIVDIEGLCIAFTTKYLITRHFNYI